MVNSYAELSDKLTVTKIDPGVNPNFVPQYTSEDVKSNSIIAVSDKRTTVAAYNDFYRYNVDGYAEMSSEEFNEFSYSYYYQYQSVPEYSMLFYGEQAITSAVSYVVADDIPSSLLYDRSRRNGAFLHIRRICDHRELSTMNRSPCLRPIFPTMQKRYS